MHGGGFDVSTLHGSDIARTLSARHDGSPCDDRGPNVVAYRTTGNAGCYATGDKVDALTTSTDPNSHVIGNALSVRRLTPVECERLQGFPDGFTAIPWRNKQSEDCPDGPRYKALGNSMAVPVMRWIGERIQMVENLEC